MVHIINLHIKSDKQSDLLKFFDNTTSELNLMEYFNITKGTCIKYFEAINEKFKKGKICFTHICICSPKSIHSNNDKAILNICGNESIKKRILTSHPFDMSPNNNFSYTFIYEKDIELGKDEYFFFEKLQIGSTISFGWRKSK